VAVTLTYANMRDRIVDELRRTDLASNVDEAIQDAIKHFSRRAHFVAQGTFTPIPCVVGQKAYALPADFSRMVQLQIVYSGTSDVMKPKTVHEIDEMDDNVTDPLVGIPEFYALWGANFVIYPRSESASYEFQGRYQTRYAAPEDDDDEGFWVNEAERPVRCFAKGVLYDDTIREYEAAEREFGKAESEWIELMAESEARAYEPGIRPWCG